MDWYLKFKLLFLLNIYACKIKAEKKCDTTNNLEEKMKPIVELHKNILMNKINRYNYYYLLYKTIFLINKTIILPCCYAEVSFKYS